MSGDVAAGNVDKRLTDAEASSTKGPTVDAAGPCEQPAELAVGDGLAGEPPSTSAPAVPPPGYRLVTVRIAGQSAAAVENLPVEVLPCHTFADLCAVALARVPDAPREYGLQAYLVIGALDVPLEDPLTPARDALRGFAASASLRFLVDPAAAAAAAAGSGGARIVRVAPRATPHRRRQQLWLRRLARVAIGVAKFVLAVEAAALLRGGLRGALRRIIGRGGSGSGEGGVGSETEAVMDAVADYVSGRGDISALARFEPQVIRGALEAMDTEVLEQLDVPDVRATRAAVSEVLQQLRKDEETAAAAAAAASSPAAPREDDDEESGPGPAAAGAAATAGLDAPAMASGAPGAEEGSAEPAPALPGFGPAPGTTATSAGAGGSRRRDRDGGAAGGGGGAARA